MTHAIHVLGVDLGTKVGTCVHMDGGIAEILTWHVKLRPSEDLQDHERWRRLHKMLDDKINRYSISHVAFEKVNNATIRGARQAQLYWGAVAVVQLVCAQLGKPVIGIPVQSVKKRLSGKGNAKKDQMLSAARSLYPTKEIEDDNAADAVGVVLCALDEINGGTINADRIGGKGARGKGRGGQGVGTGIQPAQSRVRRSSKGGVAQVGTAAR